MRYESESKVRLLIEALRADGFSDTSLVGYLMACYCEALDQMGPELRERHMRIIENRVEASTVKD